MSLCLSFGLACLSFFRSLSLADRLLAGAIVGIALGALVALCCCALLVALCVLRARSPRAPEDGRVDVANALYSTQHSAQYSARGDPFGHSPASSGVYAAGATYAAQYACEQCGKAYSYAEDLAEHISLRH